MILWSGAQFANDVVIVLVADALHVLASQAVCEVFETLKAAGAPADAKLELVIHT